MTRRLALSAALLLPAAAGPAAAGSGGDGVCAACIRAHMEFLASDALRGRGSATPDEWTAATYLAAQLRLVGVQPGAAEGGFLQRIDLVEQPLREAPSLALAGARFVHGAEILAIRVAGSVAGPLRKVSAADVATRVKPGDVALVLPAEKLAMGQVFQAVRAARTAGAVAVLVPDAGGAFRSLWKQPAGVELRRKDTPASTDNTVVLADAALKLATAQADGTRVELSVPLDAPRTRPTWNVVGRIDGEHAEEVVLLSAHLDHLGACPPVNGDAVCNGADDDASGTTAVMEIARSVAQSGRRPRRSAVFALFGSEELGGHGSTGFRESGLLPLAHIVANLQFEMIGRRDKAVRDDGLWLTGYDRSDLGPMLARHGALLVADPHPDENFFQRSDNYGFALAGVVAHTVSSYGLHADYHQPSDEVKAIDFEHMTRAIGSLFRPIRWLLDSDWRPAWAPGRKP
jgi:aminopeptidase YwaD